MRFPYALAGSRRALLRLASVAATVVLLLGATNPELAGAAPGLNLGNVTLRAPTALDSLRDRVRLARYDGDWQQARTLQDLCLRQHPGDGFVLGEVVALHWSVGTLPELAQQVDSASLEGLPPGIGQRPGDLEYLRGLVDWNRADFPAALAHFDKAVELAPAWSWPRYRRALVLREMAAPWSRFEPDLQAALDDPDTAPMLIEDLCDPSDRSWPAALRREAMALLPRLVEVPWRREVPDWVAALDGLDRGQPTRARFDSVRTALAARHGSRTSHYLAQLCGRAVLLLPPADAQAFLESCCRGREACPGRLQLARLWKGLEYTERAESLLAVLPSPDPSELYFLVDAGLPHAPGALLLQRTRRLLASSIHPSHCEAAQRALEALQRDDELAALRQGLESNPEWVVRKRLEKLLGSDVNAASTVLDSLEHLGAAAYAVATMRPGARELRGDTVSVAELQALRRDDAAYKAAWLADLAATSGRKERARRLSRLAVSRLDSNVDFLAGRIYPALRDRDEDLARQILARLDVLAPDAPATVRARLEFGTYRRDHARCTADIRQALRRSPPPSFAASLVWYAHSLGEPGLADSCLAAAEAQGSDSRYVQFMRAWLQVQRRDMAPARSRLEMLVHEFPGRKEYRSLLVEAGGSVHSLPELASSAEDGPSFAAFDYDLSSTDWIRARRVRSDSLRGESAVHLLERSSYLCDRVESYAVRRRLTVQILGQDALSTYQPLRLTFLPREGMPRILMARVVHPDGRVNDVPREDIVISGVSTADADVSDMLQASIPFPDLKVGDVLDLAYDRVYASLFSSGWSFRHAFGAGVPTLEEVLEIRCREGTRVHASPGGPTPLVTTAAPYVNYTWRLTRLPVQKFEPASDPYALVPWVGCSNYGGWEPAATSYQDTFWRNVTAADSIAALVNSLTAGLRKPEEKLQALFAHVQDRVQYLAIELDRGSVIPSPAIDVLRRGYGDCKDMVALLLALLQAAEIEAWPVLVTSSDGERVLTDLVEMEIFTHVIVYVPSLDVYVDPTYGAKRAGELDPSIGGVTGLALPRHKPPKLQRLPPARAEDHGIALRYDVWPRSDREAEVRVTGEFRGCFAAALRDLLAAADTTAVHATVDRCLGFGLWSSCRRTEWRREPDATSITLSAVYRDSAWTQANQTSVRFQLATEIADPFLRYPAAKARQSAVLLPYPFRDRVTLRLHAGAGWHPSPEIAAVSVHGSFYDGKIGSRVVQVDGSDCVEIEQSFEVREPEIPADRYAAFRHDWERFSAGIWQPFHFQKRLASDEIARLQGYAAQHPDDEGFALNAASRVLGSDLGGDGEAGRERREVARRILEPAARRADPPSMACMLLAGILAKEGRHVAADSVVAEAVRRDPADVGLISVLAGSKAGLGDWTAYLDLAKQILRKTGNEELLLAIVTQLHAMERLDEARDYEERYFALRGAADSSEVFKARLQGQVKANRCDLAAATLRALEGNLPPKESQTYKLTYHLDCGPLQKAIEILEDWHSENPIDPLICNNLAWVYALTGKDLERAEELARAAALLSDDPAASSNTLGTVLARQGRWEEARELFLSLCLSDDRPPNVALNSYFVGLCDYQTGKRREALERWQQALSASIDPLWRRRIEASLKLAAEGSDVTQPIFEKTVAAP